MVAVAESGTRYLSIGTVAKLVGCSPTTLREMEARGLLPFTPARLDGQDTRLYRSEDVATIRRVREALRRQREASAA